MNREELNKAMEQTINDISEVKRQIAGATESQEIERLEGKLKELEALQLWQIEKLG
ncbi:hypothetical protein Psch_01418 [Pelotomaculum schinkii]|uniref:Uncharacterized protein n=1 Tax=Pelotomaculum schinkii TaxID=78350 RepID=A0A4Y7RGF1_9FIRM|nr:hypothetical protein [Pelotomaculum schinkii]TEB07863.1 hypothetical protein Psch_01418 [Pelotomaculum schinkii]